MVVREFVLVVDRVPSRTQRDAIVAGAAGLEVRSDPWRGIGRIVVAREASSLLAAVVVAVRDVEAVGLRAMRVEDAGWVTLAEVADRIGRARETVRLWSIGKVGPGGFPPPVNPTGSTSFYSWVEVAGWLRERLGLDLPPVESARMAANLALQLRALGPDTIEVAPICALIRGATTYE